MLRENRLLLAVLAVIVLAIATPFAVDAVREALRPRLVEVRVVSWTDRDPVLRDGPRTVAEDEQASVAVALRLQRLGRGSAWLAPGEPLVLGGVQVAEPLVGPWPDDRPLRVFWFTVECPTVTGELTEANAADRLAHRTFLAPEMGGRVTALELPAHHAVASLGRRPDEIPFDGGTSRLYARVEVVRRLQDVRPLTVVTSAPAAEALAPDYPALHRQGRLPAGLHPAAGELFRLPSFEPTAADPASRDLAPVAATELSFSDLVRRRVLVSSASFAAVAMTGEPVLAPDVLEEAVPVRVERARFLGRRGPLRWGVDLQPGDALVDRAHWIVLAEDDGDGELGPGDRVAHAWRRPPAITRLGLVLSSDVETLELVRHGR